jgi:hypothetical protein
VLRNFKEERYRRVNSPKCDFSAIAEQRVPILICGVSNWNCLSLIQVLYDSIDFCHMCFALVARPIDVPTVVALP